jgi:hypothetical protein
LLVHEKLADSNIPCSYVCEKLLEALYDVHHSPSAMSEFLVNFLEQLEVDFCRNNGGGVR